MIRTIVTPQHQNISIKVPQEFVGKQVEIIAFTIEDTLDVLIARDIPLTYIASEKSLAKDWLTKEEDEAWKTL